MIFGYFEFLVFGLVLGFNIFFLKKSPNLITYFFIVLLFGIIFPSIAMKIEIELSISKGMERDGMNFLWTTFKFPIYWFIGVLEILFLVLKKNKN